MVGEKSICMASVTGVAMTFCTGIGLFPELSSRSLMVAGGPLEGSRPKSIDSCKNGKVVMIRILNESGRNLSI